MSEIKSLAAPKASFDRRAVVKGAAWSVPVIAAAIAAPAAAASVNGATAAFDAEGSVIVYPQSADATKTKSGTGPTGFHIKNTPGAITGTITASITITPVAAGVKPVLGVGVRTFPMAKLTTSEVVADSYQATFSYAGGVTSNATLTFPMDFYFTGALGTETRNFNLDVTFTLPGGRILNVPRTNLRINKV